MKKLFLVLFLLTGCQTVSDFFFPTTTEKDAKLEWRKDITIQVDDKVYRGIALVPVQPVYQIKIWPSDDKIDRLQWRTCHREDYVDKAVKRGFWPWDKKQEFFSMSFSPKEVELERSCPLMIDALAEKHKSMSFGMIIFPDTRPWINLEARLECDGRVYDRAGTSECQGAVDTIHKIQFLGEVFQDDRPNDKCPPMKQIKSNLFEFFMPKDVCIYLFKSAQKDKSGKYRTHKILTYGYERIPPPEGV